MGSSGTLEWKIADITIVDGNPSTATGTCWDESVLKAVVVVDKRQRMGTVTRSRRWTPALDVDQGLVRNRIAQAVAARGADAHPPQ
jgi:hypothetical protein